MSTKIITEQRIVTCDCCLREIGNNGVWRAQNGGIIVKRDALDYQGAPCADAGISLDLCDKCLGKIVRVINAECLAIRSVLPSCPDGTAMAGEVKS